MSVRPILVQATELYHAGNLDEAERQISSYLKRNASDPYALLLASQIAFDRGNSAQAEFLVKRSIALRPEVAVAHGHLARTLWSLNRSEEAVPIIRRAVELMPQDPGLWSSCGHILAAARRYEEAIAAYQRSLQLNPADNEPAYQGLGQTYGLLGRWNESLAFLLQGCANMPDNPRIASDYAAALNFVSECTPMQQRAAHAEIGRRMSLHPAPRFPRPPAPADPGKKLRVGLMSGDLAQHPVAFFMEPILSCRDQNAVEYVFISTRAEKDTDAWTRRLREQAAAWTSILGCDELRAGEIILKQKCDILIDLAGHTLASAVWMFRSRLAPVQMTYLGYPNTTGLPQTDYRLVADTTDPAGYEAYTTERLLRLGPCMHCYRAPPEAPPVAASRRPGPIRFGSFNVAGKISTATIDLWVRVLKAVLGSTLLLKSNSIESDASWVLLRRAFEAAGLEPHRLVGVARTKSLREHLALYDDLDVALDPTPYNGTTTTCEALWMGVPVVALWGDRHAARVSGSLLTAAGLPELIADTPEAYVELARALADDEPRRARYRATLRDQVAGSMLCDGPGMARRFEAALRTAWKDACSAQPSSPSGLML